MSIAANCASLIGCMSPGLVNLALYRVKVAVLAGGLQRLASNNSQNAPELLHPELPTYWYWGTSGVCDVYSNGETRCRHQFPPTNGLITIVEESLRDRLGSAQEPLVNDIVSSWNATLNNIDPSKLRNKEAKFTAESKAAVALAILAIILDGVISLLALLLGGSCSLYSASFFSALISIGAATLSTYSMYDGVHGVVETGEHGGLGIILVFVGAALRILSSIPGPCCRSRSKRDVEGGFPLHPPPINRPHDQPYSPPYNPPYSPPYDPPGDNTTNASQSPWGHGQTREDRNGEIGYLGEKHLYRTLSILPFLQFLHTLTMVVLPNLDTTRWYGRGFPASTGATTGRAITEPGRGMNLLDTKGTTPISRTLITPGRCGRSSATGASLSIPDGRTIRSITSR